jgi:putative oxidoreductase
MNTTIQTLAAPAGRVLLSVLFLMAGLGKLGDLPGTQAYMGAMGVPALLLPVVILLEVGGAAALIVGWQARIVAFLLAGFSLVSAVIFHHNFGDQVQMIMFLKNVSIAGGLLTVVAHGAGALSIDNRRRV